MLESWIGGSHVTFAVDESSSVTATFCGAVGTKCPLCHSKTFRGGLVRVGPGEPREPSPILTLPPVVVTGLGPPALFVKLDHYLMDDRFVYFDALITRAAFPSERRGRSLSGTN